MTNKNSGSVYIRIFIPTLFSLYNNALKFISVKYKRCMQSIISFFRIILEGALVKCVQKITDVSAVLLKIHDTR